MLLLMSLAEGRFFDFYQICFESAFLPAFYGIIIYVIIAIWNLPVVVFFKITTGDLNFTSENVLFVGTYWSKILLILLTVVAARLIFLIITQVGIDDNRALWASYVFLASPIILFNVVGFGQCDIIMLDFLLAALLYYVRNQPYKFALLMAFAIPCKFFAVFPFIPLVLLIEKRVVHIIKYLAIGTSVYFATQFPFTFHPEHEKIAAHMDSFGFIEQLLYVFMPIKLQSPHRRSVFNMHLMFLYIH